MGGEPAIGGIQDALRRAASEVPAQKEPQLSRLLALLELPVPPGPEDVASGERARQEAALRPDRLPGAAGGGAALRPVPRDAAQAVAAVAAQALADPPGEAQTGMHSYSPTLDLSARKLLDTAPLDGAAAPRLERDVDDTGGWSVGRFEILGLLGEGGMGRVVEGRDPDLGRSVAIKLLRDPSVTSRENLQRFVSEARITAQLEHPNIVPVHEIALDEQGQLYYTMKKVEGVSLDRVLASVRDGAVELDRYWSLHRLLTGFSRVCQAISYAHRRGVLHRDLKPPNIMLGSFGEVLVLDWGLARLIDRDIFDGDSSPAEGGDEPDEQDDPDDSGYSTRLTRAGSVVGTPGYMSPEQAGLGDGDADARSDVWSLGAILYEILTLSRAYNSDDVMQLLYLSSDGPPEDPRVRAPDRHIPAEIAKIALRALSPDPNERYLDAGELGQEVERFLEGSKRREEALQRLEEGREAKAEYNEINKDLRRLEARERRLSVDVPAWTPIEEKHELLDLTDRLEQLRVTRSTTFGRIVAAGERALSHDPGNPEARAFLAAAYWNRLAEAERLRDSASVAYYEHLVQEYDDGPFLTRLRGTGTVSLRTNPAGAEVICERFEQQGLVWQRRGQRVLGTTPLERVALEMGSYLLTIRAPGRRDTSYPVFINRGQDWEAGGAAVPLLSDTEIGPGMRYVPAGPFRQGGDPDAVESLPAAEPWLRGFVIAELPVTVTDYVAFLNALHIDDPAAAFKRAPRHTAGLEDHGESYLRRPEPTGRYRIPTQDSDGDDWDPGLPVFSISWFDAQAYAAWKSEQDGLPWALPLETEWEKAARGVDGRWYPWGDRGDAALCKMTSSRAGRPQPEAAGTFASDVSVYGVQDTAGSMREWCGDTSYDDDGDRRPARGGSWVSSLRQARLANRHGIAAQRVQSFLGFRLCRSLRPDPVGD